ncbi:MAG: TonB-dependent receptor [Verrucomicrobia bacterium]|nr:TonB-dependent receptor [Verrucomicrobiota bacterium]
MTAICQEAATPPAAMDTSGMTAAQMLNPMVVTGMAPHPENQTIAEEITERAANLEVVQSRQEIARYPDVRLGDSLKRLPGIGLQYNQGQGLYASVRGIDPNLVGITFGGVRVPATDALGRHVSLNQIPSDLVSQIVLTESNTPDQDAEALGGTIELTPRSAFDSSKVTLEGRIGSGFLPLRPGYPIIDGSITAGTTFGFGPGGNPFRFNSDGAAVGQPNSPGDGKGLGNPAPPTASANLANPRPFGVLGDFTYYDDHVGVDNFQATYNDGTPATYDTKLLNELDFYNFTFHRRTYGYGGSFDYRPSENLWLYVNFADGGYVESDVRYGLSLLNLNTAASATGAPATDVPDSGTFRTTSGELLSSLRYKTAEHHDNQVLSGGGRALLGPLIVDFRGSFAQGYSFSPLDSTLNFTTPKDEVISYNNAGTADRPTVILGGAPGTTSPFDPNHYKFSSLTIDRNGSTDTEVAGAINVTAPFTLAGYSAAVKFGTNLRFRDKDRYDDPQTYSAYHGPAVNGENNLTLADVAGSSFYSVYDGYYPIGFSPSLPKFQAFMKAFGGGFVRNARADQVTSLQAYFDDTENVYAGYVQGDISFGRLNLLAGVRLEATNADYGAYANSPGTDPTAPSSYRFVNRYATYSNLFPSFQAKYQFTDYLQARFAYSTAIGRPTFGQVTAATIVNQVDRTITSGNPDLKPTTDNSFDLAVDFYPVKGALFTVGIFDKELANYVFQRSLNVLVNSVNYTETTYLNGGSAYARGIEFNYQQQFGFLPGPLSGFGIAANYTYVDSRGNAHPTQPTKLPYTAPNLWNIGLFYDKYGFKFSLAATFTDRNLEAIGSSTLTDRYFDTEFHLDLSISYLFFNGTGIYFHTKNLTNQAFRVYEGSTNRPIQREFYGETYEAGIQFRF